MRSTPCAATDGDRRPYAKSAGNATPSYLTTFADRPPAVLAKLRISCVRDGRRSPRCSTNTLFVLEWVSYAHPFRYPNLTETIAAILHAHRTGAVTPADTVARSYSRIRAHNDPAVFISDRLPLEQYPDAIEKFKAGQGRKIVVEP